MGRKGIILALVIFIGLGLYVFFVERKKPVSEGKKELILKFDKDKARRLILSRDGKEIVLDRDKDGKWQITSPILTKADDEVVKDLVNGLSGLESSQVLEVLPSEWEDFGLRKPKCEVIILIEGNREEKLSFGDKNPAGTSTYARMRGKDKVYLLSTYAADGFNKDVPDLREKRVLLFDKEKVTAVELIYEGKDILLEKHGEEWQVSKPIKDKGDKYEIEGLISAIYDLKADGFIDKIEKGETYGLDVPGVKCILWTGPEKIAQTAVFGKTFKEQEKDFQYAQRELLSTIFKVEPDKVNALKKSVFDLRNKIILSFERDKIDKIALVYPEKSLVMERQRAKKEGEEDKWFLAGGEKIELDSDKVNDILWELTDLKAKDILAEKINDPAAYGLDKPEVKAVINVWGVGKKIMLGKKVSEKEDTIYASVEGDPRLFLVSDELSSRLKKDLSELKKTAPPVAQGGVVEKKEEKQD